MATKPKQLIPAILRPPARTEALYKPGDGRALFWFDLESPSPLPGLRVLSREDHFAAFEAYASEGRLVNSLLDIPTETVERVLEVLTPQLEGYLGEYTPWQGGHLAQYAELFDLEFVGPVDLADVLRGAAVLRLDGDGTVEPSSDVCAAAWSAWVSAYENETIAPWACVRVMLLAARYADSQAGK